ncbi:MAG: enoyl-CoA hydratase [Proteobacteria bacterium]|nr:enoyl-CoA hydratase [Pseudomonadota bacterium]
MADYKHILYEIKDRIATITLNRTERLNAWTVLMKDEMIDAFDKADKDDDIRVVIVTGAGRAFCAGADLTPEDFEQRREDRRKAKIPPRDTAGELTLKIYDTRKPVIAAINGPAVGVGCTMTLAMDIRLISEKAKMGLVFNRRGMVPEGCCTWFLPRIIGFSHAAEWIYTGRVFSPQEAFEKGLVSRVLPPDDLLPAARELALEIIGKTSAMSTAFSRSLLWQMMSVDHPMEAHKIESECLNYMFLSDDVAEGVTSFLEKRPPEFKMGPERDKPDFYPWWTERQFEED